MYRNFQWFLAFKKFVFVLPLQMKLLTEHAAVFAMIECNGAQGIINAKKGNSNNEWIFGGEGDRDETHGIIDRYDNPVNYKDSTKAGDARITVLMKEDGINIFQADIIDANIGLIWNSILKGGHVMPDILGVNLGPILRLGFLQEEVVDPDEAGPDGPYWKNRNRLFPLIVGLVGILHERSYYEPPVNPDDYDYNYSGNHTYPIQYVIDGVLAPLIKPMFRHYTDSGGRWVPRIQAAPGGEDSNNFLARLGTSGVNHNPRGSLFTIAGLLSESERFKADGIIPALTKTKFVTKFIELIDGLGKSEYDDPGNVDYNDAETWGARRKFFYGLEQIMTTIRTPKGDVFNKKYIEEANYPSWIFTENISSDIADRTLNLETIMDEVIGTYESDGKGLAGFVFRRENSMDPDPWGNYNKFMAALPELLSNNGTTGGKYNLMEDFIQTLDDLFMKVATTDEELQGLRHTLGTVFYRYKDENWEIAPEVINIVTVRFPDIYESYREEGGSASRFFNFARVLLRDEGFAQYLASVMETGHSTEELLLETYTFLGSPIMYNADPLWNDLADLLYYSSQCMEKRNGNSNYQNAMLNPLAQYSTDYFDVLEPESELDEEEESDPFTTLGKLLSH